MDSVDDDIEKCTSLSVSGEDTESEILKTRHALLAQFAARLMPLAPPRDETAAARRRRILMFVTGAVT